MIYNPITKLGLETVTIFLKYFCRAFSFMPEFQSSVMQVNLNLWEICTFLGSKKIIGKLTISIVLGVGIPPYLI